MRALILVLSLVVSLLVVPLANAAKLSYPVSLPTPKVESLVTSLNPTGGAVNVQLQVQYDLAGLATYTGTVDGTVVAGKATLGTSANGTTYKFSVRAATVPSTVLSISGKLGTNTASCSYTGPKGKTNVLANPVTVGVVQPVPATLHVDPVINYKNMVNGTAPDRRWLHHQSDHCRNRQRQGDDQRDLAGDKTGQAFRHLHRQACGRCLFR